MDFVRLGPRYTTNYVPTDLIEGYNSLIWTERFFDHGEFELKSFDVMGLKALLPADTLVSHLETKHVMQVETHEINMVGEGADAQPEITIRGRAATNIFEHRWVESAYQKKRRMRQKYSATSALGVLMWNAVVNNSGADVTRGDNDPETEGVVNHYAWTTQDVLPNTAISEVVAAEGGTRWWQLEEGLLWPRLQQIMVDADLGIRCIRPVSPAPGKVFTVKTALADRGTPVRTDDADITQLRFEIYSGVDRTSSVQFSHLQGHIEDPIYLESSQIYKTVIEMMSDEISLSDVTRAGEAGLTGWKRRTEGFDAGTPEIPPKPEKPDDLGRNPTAAERNAYYDRMDAWKTKMGKWRNKRDLIVADFREESALAAQRLLKERRRLDMFSGDISTLSPYQYKTHYDLGDKVSLFGDYGKSSTMIVSEYVRTEDANGDRGFPGLVAP